MTKETPESLQATIDSINSNIAQLEEKRKELNKHPEKLSDTRIFMHIAGLDNSKAVQLLYSLNLDNAIDSVVQKFLNGDISDVSKYADKISKVLEMVGINGKSFSGEVSQIFLSTLKQSVNNQDFQKSKSNIDKMLMVLKNMKRETKVIDDPAVKKKYKEALLAFKKIIQLIKKVMKDRRIIMTGINNVVNEEVSGEKILYIWPDEELDDFGEVS